MNELNDQHIYAINKIAVLGAISEMSALEMIDGTRMDLRQRVKRLSAAAKSIQSYFQNHENAGNQKSVFKSEFNSGRIVLMSEIFSYLVKMDEDGLESVLNSISEAINQ